MTEPTELYLDLLKRSLLNIPYLENEVRLRFLMRYLAENLRRGEVRPLPGGMIYALEDIAEIRQEMQAHADVAVDGRTPRAFAHAMMGRQRLDNIQFCIETLLAEGIAGDFLEAGAWKGAGPILMRGVLKAHGVDDRTIWIADSFEGVPVSTLPQDLGINLSKSAWPWISVSEPRVKALIERYGLWDQTFRFLPGWFKDTLGSSQIGPLALLRMDGDLYESTLDTLDPLYDKVVPGGFIIADDYGAIDACRQAVDEFRARRGITDPIVKIDWTGVYWRKGA